MLKPFQKSESFQHFAAQRKTKSPFFWKSEPLLVASIDGNQELGKNVERIVSGWYWRRLLNALAIFDGTQKKR